MKSLIFDRVKEVFPGSRVMSIRAFKNIEPREKSALLARANHRLSSVIAMVGEHSALFTKADCFECLSPHKTAA